MNERVKELAEQAWDATAVSPDFGHPVSFAEKLSELIVNECQRVSLTCSHRDDDMGAIIARRIKEYFGIK